MRARTNFHAALLASVFGLSVLAVVQPGQAQTAAPAKPAPPLTPARGGPEDVVITAQRRSERLQRVPVAVTAFTRAALKNRGVNNLEDLGHFTPSLVIQPTNRPGGGGSSIAAYIRGVGTGDYNIPTDPAIGVYIDGVYLARSVGGLLSLPDVERIEVLKGPQGTLYGRNTLGGAISIVTSPANTTGAPTGLVETHLGTDGRADLITSLNGPIIEDKLGGKLSVSTYNFGGYGHDDYNGHSFGDEHRVVVRGALRFQFSDDLRLDIDADYTHQAQMPPVSAVQYYVTGSPLVPLYNKLVAPRLDAQLGLRPGSVFGPDFATGNPYNNNAGSNVRDSFDNAGLAATFNYTPSESFQVKSITAVRGLDAQIDVDGDQQPYNVLSDNTQERDVQISQELQFSGKLLDNRLTYVAGLYYFSELGHSDELLEVFHGLYEATHARALALDTHTYQRLRDTSYAAYTQETFAVTPTIDITAGGRFNYEQKVYNSTELAPQLNSVLSPNTRAQPDWASFLPKAGIDWKPTAHALVYLSYSEGFKSGGISPPTGDLAPKPYRPEDLRTWEIGAKTDWFNRRLTFNTAAYYSRYADVQLTSVVDLPNGSIAKPVLNGGDAHIWGYEAEFVAVPMDGLTLNLGAAYTHDRFSYLLPGTVAALHAYTGERLPDIPDFNLTFGTQYVFPTNIGEFTLRTDLSVAGETQLTIGDPTSYQSPVTLLNARVAYNPARVPNLEMYVMGTNLGNKLYFTYDQTQVATDEHLVEAAVGREVYFGARYHF